MSRRIDFVVRPATAPLLGSVPVPSDKSVGHRGLLFGAIASGRVELRGFTYGEDNLATAAALRALGVRIDDDGKGTLTVGGVGLRGLREAATPLDCGNSGTTMRLMTGLLAAQPFASTLVGDPSLSRRPMARVAAPLRRRGARVEGAFHPTKAGEITAPLTVGPQPADRPLSGCEERLAVASAQVKSALLLSGLYAEGPTYVSEPLVSRDHTERLLRALGVPVRTAGSMVELDVASWSGELPGFELDVPGDLSAAAFLLVAAQLVEGSRVTVRDCGLNTTRAGVLDVLRDAGAGLVIEPRGDRMGEAFGELTASFQAARGTLVAGELLTRSVDEVPALCALAARAHGVTEFADAAELRVKESDRLASMAGVLRAFGVACQERPDGLLVEGKPEGRLRAADVESRGDHRIAMASVLLGLVGDADTRVRDVACVATSFPRFAGTLRALGADVSVVEAE